MSDSQEYTKKELEHKFAQDFSNITFPQWAEIYFSEYDFNRSRLVCEIGLKHVPNNFEGQYVLAKIELIEGNTIKAERILKKIFKSNKSFYKAIKLLIEVRDSLDRSKIETKKIVDTLLSQSPDDIFAHQWLKDQENDLPQTTNDSKVEIFNVNPNILSVTFYEILKSQRYYKQAYNVLNDLNNTKKIDASFYKQELNVISELNNKWVIFFKID